MIKTTLQNRLIMLMVVFSVFSVVIFTMIQLSNQLGSITNFNIYRSKIGSLVTKNYMEHATSTLAAVDEKSVKEAFQSSLMPLIESNVVEKALLISKDGKIAGSLSPYGPDILSSQDRRQLELINSMNQRERWFFSYIDKKLREADIFIRFMKDDTYFIKLTYNLGNIQDAFNEVYGPILITIIIVIIANIVFGMLLSKAIIQPIKMFNDVTKDVAAGNLDLKLQISTQDELQELGETFNYMTIELKKMKERAENANPLTKLPGNLVIMEDVERRILNKEKFTVIYCDLNNFKAFNDKYGIHQGDEAIKMTATTMKEAVRDRGNSSDLVGHEGGDDFVIVTTPDKADAVAREIIEKFDARVRPLYKPEDITEESFMSTDRDGTVRKFPIMGIALSGVTNQHRGLANYGEVTNICAEVKKKVKLSQKSAWWMDQRTT